MFEAKLSEGIVFKKIIDSIKDIVTDVNIDISPSGNRPNLKKRRIITNIVFRYFTLSNGQLSRSSSIIEPQYGRF